MTRKTVLVVEDDDSQATLICSVLEMEQRAPSRAKTVRQARRILEKAKPDLIILDRMLPDMEGVEFCKELRSRADTKTIPILFLTARKSSSEKVVGLRMGGDDYLTKPFDNQELAARVEVLLRRVETGLGSVVSLKDGGLDMDVDGSGVRLKGKDLELTKKEFDLLRAFLERPGRTLSRTFLLANVWGYGMELQLNTKAVDVMLVGLRRKLGEWGQRIKAVKGSGYRLAPEKKRRP